MRKKIIKFYFYNTLNKNSIARYLFCFSKRSFRQNRQTVKYKKKTRRSFSRRSSRIKFYEFLLANKVHKCLINIKIKNNHWNKIRRPLRLYFIRSFFFHTQLFNNSRVHHRKHMVQLKLWFVLKNKYNRFTLKYVSKLHKLGALSSDIAHYVSRKNLSYQPRSKYRAKAFNMNFYNEWFYNSSKRSYIYAYFLLGLIYSFSSDPRARTIVSDENFNIIANPLIATMSLKTTKPEYLWYQFEKKTTGPIYTHPTNKDLSLLLKHDILIESFLSEPDKTKQEDTKHQLDIYLDTLSIIFLSRFFVWYSNHPNPNIHKIILYTNIKVYAVILNTKSK